MEPPSGFEHGTPGLGITTFNLQNFFKKECFQRTWPVLCPQTEKTLLLRNVKGAQVIVNREKGRKR